MNRDDEIFADAIELPADQRAALLDRACADDRERRARIEALLDGYDAAGDFLEHSAGAPPPLPDEEKPGDVIGRYCLLQKIGEGGCGSVYLAEQKLPVHRRVALKVIKLGMDTRAVIARFEAERQALALMDHPDIARVFDAGATGAGRPYFVMELVEGLPITKFCDEHKLSIAARLELFARVCVALQHAHQKGIIHRDVKPSNILVALRDGEPAPKVIDFGIAKATQERLTEHTLVTGVDQFIGTPAYMSPEQADRRDGDIDTRSDVYALGVLLYELLSGRLPFDPKTLGRVGVDELRRIIREVEPPRPSALLRTHVLEPEGAQEIAEKAEGRSSVRAPSSAASARSGAGSSISAGLDRTAAARGATPRQLAAALRGDLDWIVMRCLEKDRDRRYASARELADDVQRYLRKEPVEARPPSAAYRAGRFVARNRLACASAAAIALALIVGTVVSVRQAVRATQAEQIANAERDLAQAASRAEAVARTDAQRRQEQAEDLLTFMLGDFRTELQKIGRLALLDSVGEKAMAYFAALDPRDLTDTALSRQAKALTQIGEIRMDQARYADAHAAFTAAYERAAALSARHPQNGDMLFERAQAEYWIGFVARRRGDLKAEREWLTRYRDSAAMLVAIEGKTLRAHGELTAGCHNLAVVDFDHGDLGAASRGFEEERGAIAELLEQEPDNLELRFRMATATAWLGNIAECEGAYARALERYATYQTECEWLVEREPKVADRKYMLAQSLAFVGNVHALLGRRSDAFAAYAAARSRIGELLVIDDQNKQWRLESLHTQLAEIHLRLASDDPADLIPALAEIREKLELLVQAEPSSRVFTRLLARVYQVEASAWFAVGHLDAAARANGRAIELNAGLVKEDARADGRVKSETAQAYILAGRIAAARGEHTRARELWESAVALFGPAVQHSRDWRLLDPTAQALVLLGKSEEARPLLERLQASGYHPANPFAAAILAAASLPGSETQKP